MKKYLIITLLFIFNAGISQVKEITEKFNLPKDWILVIDPFEKIGFITKDGFEIVPPKYDIIYGFGELKEDWMRVQIYNSEGIIDKEGNTIIEPQYDFIEKFGKYGNNIALICKNGLYGFINSYGEEIVAPIYKEIPSNLSFKTFND